VGIREEPPDNICRSQNSGADGSALWQRQVFWQIQAALLPADPADGLLQGKVVFCVRCSDRYDFLKC